MKPESSEDPLIAVISRALGRWLPPVDTKSMPEWNFKQLKRRNRALDAMTQILCVAGLAAGVFLPLAVRGHPLRFKTVDIGVLLGLGVALPTILILLVAAFQGKPRFLDFLTFYTIKYGVDARKLFLFIYIPMILQGIVCAGVSYFGPNA